MLVKSSLVPVLRNGKLKLIDKQIIDWRRRKRAGRKYGRLLKVRLMNVFDQDLGKVDQFMSTFHPILGDTPYNLIARGKTFKVWHWVRYNLLTRTVQKARIKPE